MLGRPFGDGYMSANISAGNSASRCSARNANTLPAGISSRQVSHTSGPTSSPATLTLHAYNTDPPATTQARTTRFSVRLLDGAAHTAQHTAGAYSSKTASKVS